MLRRFGTTSKVFCKFLSPVEIVLLIPSKVINFFHNLVILQKAVNRSAS